MGAGHHDEDGEQPTDRDDLERGDAPALLHGPARGGRDARLIRLVEEAGHVPRVDGGDDPVDEQDDVHGEHRLEDDLLGEERQQVGAVRAQDDTRDERDDQQRRGGKGECTRVRAGIGMSQPGEQQGQECSGEGGPLPGPALDGRAPLVARRLGDRHRAE
jgi:hypothetical protein